jgi:hypothetical protein
VHVSTSGGIAVLACVVIDGAQCLNCGGAGVVAASAACRRCVVGSGIIDCRVAAA